jgi:hypothetical protein
MSNKKQTSIDYLWNDLIANPGNYIKAYQKAKAMHKQEIIDSANKLLYHGTGPGDTAAKQYYNETFGGEDESNH